MTKIEAIRQEALDRAQTGQSWANYPVIFEGFTAMGIPEHDIKPRENVFTFQAWKAKDRSVKKGQHGVKVVTFINIDGKPEIDEATGETKHNAFRKPHTTTVFHISQTEPTAEAEARWSRNRRDNVYKGRRYGHRAVIVRGKVDNSDLYADPGELAAEAVAIANALPAPWK